MFFLKITITLFVHVYAVCMCSCLCAHMCMGAHAHMCPCSCVTVNMWRPVIDDDCLLQLLSTVFFKVGPLIEPGAHGCS